MAQAALIKITIDPSKGIATINGVKVALNDLANAQKRVNEEIEENNKAIEGSLKYYNMQLAKLKAQREAVSTNSEEYDRQTVAIKNTLLEIERITANREMERGVIAGSFQDYENQIKMLRRQQKEYANTNAAVLEYEARIQKLRAEQRSLATDTKLTGKGMQTMSTASGLAGAAATEFGRTIGDLPYGIQGVSNNVQQLSALFTDLVQSEGGLNKALKTLGTTLIGPAGILVAVSLVTTAYEFFIRKQKEATKEVERLDLAIFAQGKTFRELTSDLDDLNTSQEDQIKTLKVLALGNSDLKNIISDENLTIKERISLGKELVAATKLQQEAESVVQKQLKESNKAYKDLDITRSGLIEAQQNQIYWEKQLEGTIGQGRESVSNYISTYKEQVRLIKQGLEDRKELTKEGTEFYETQQAVNAVVEKYNDIIKERSKDEEVIIANSIKDYEKRIAAIKEEMSNVDLQSEKYQELDKELTKLTATYNELLLTQRMLDIQAAENAMEAADARIEAAMESLSSEQKLFFKRKEINAREKGEEEDFLSWAKGYYKSLSENQAFSEEERIRFRDLYLNYKEQLDDREAKGAKETAEKITAAFNERMNALLDVSKAIASFNDFLSSEAQREIDIETNKTNAINEQLRDRLRNEELSKEERDRINQEISRNEAALVDRENAINERRFKQQKAFNIAISTIDTFVAANQVLKDPTLVTPFAKFAAMASVIIKGLANVATISRQQFVGRVAKTPTLRGTTASEGSSPSFNVVGASGQNQLAQAIEGISAKPIKTYVVSSDVSSAQELDRKIVEGASI